MRVAIIGNGVAGSFAAAALARRGADVTVLERDSNEALDQPSRPGSPQSGQLHNLLGRAQRHLDELMPGFVDTLVADGYASAEVSGQTHVYELGTRMPERDCGLRLVSAPKPEVERLAQRMLPPGVRVRHGVQVTGLRLRGDRVRGLETSDGPVHADAVVDAGGATSRTLRWLEQAARPVPRVETFDVRQWYCTVVVRRSQEWIGQPDFWLTFPTHPRSRGGLVSPLGTDCWYVSMSGLANDPRPRTWEQVVTYARSLEDDAIARLLVDASPLTVPSVFGRPVATWRRWDEWQAPVDGLLPVGDAVATLNPLLGQGISVAAWQAAGLGETAGGPDWTARYHRHAAQAAGAAWQMTRIFEPNTDRLAITPAGWDRIVGRISDNVQAHARYVRVWHLLEPAETLVELAASVGEERNGRNDQEQWSR